MAAPKGNHNASVNWIGREYGFLTVIGELEGRLICRCICGKEIDRGKQSVYPTSSCGCRWIRKGNKLRPGNPGRMKRGLEATERPTTLDIAWAAGIFEGEGSFAFVRDRRSGIPSIQIQITQKDPWILNRFRALFGGSVRKRSEGQFSITPDGTRHVRDIFDWYVSGTRARGFLMTVWKFLSPRRHEQVFLKRFTFRNLITDPV